MPSFLLPYRNMLRSLVFFFLLYQATVVLTLVGSFLYKYVLVRERDLVKRYGEESWVVITGASRGQGRQWALKMAKRGFNIMILGSKRSYDVEKEIKKRYPMVKTKVIVCDFSQSFEPDFFEKIEKEMDLEERDCSLLINNVGYRTGYIPSHKLPLGEVKSTIACGTLPQVRLAQLLIPHFLKRKKRSGLVFIGAQAVHPNLFFSLGDNQLIVPYINVYESTKTFGNHYAEGVAREYGHQLDVVNFTPGAVITEKTSSFLTGTIFATDANHFVENMIGLLGNVSGTTCAYWKHAISHGLVALFPFIKRPILELTGRRIAINYMKIIDKKTKERADKEGERGAK